MTGFVGAGLYAGAELPNIDAAGADCPAPAYAGVALSHEPSQLVLTGTCCGPL
jgi:hypothetical protein